MRILHIFDHSLPLHSGYSFRSLAILRAQRKRGWETFHVTTPRHTLAGPDPETVSEGMTYYRTPAPNSQIAVPGAKEIAEIRATARRIETLLPDIKPDILHAHSPLLTAAAALLVSRRHRLPVVYEIRATWEDAAVANGGTTAGSLRYKMTRLLETHISRRVDAVACICEGLRGEMLSRGISKDRLFTVPNAVDVSQFTDDLPRDTELSNQLGLEGCEVVGFLGSFYDYEGLDVLLEAAAILSARRPKFRVLLVGGGPVEAALRAQIERLALQSVVIMVGRVPQREVNRYYSLVDVLAYPRHKSRLTDLVTPLKPLEAMAQGKLVVASDVDGHRELIRSGVTGELFKAGSPADLASVLERLFERRDMWPKYRDAGLAFVRSERTWEKSVDAYGPVYERLLQTGRAA